MARRTFFSFHYEPDVSRAWVVRNSWVTKVAQGEREDAGFFDSSVFEATKRESDDALKRFLREGLRNTSVTCVLVGAETCLRRWVRYEIFQSFIRGNGLLAVRIHSIGSIHSPDATLGSNPFDCMAFTVNEGTVGFREIMTSGWQPARYVATMPLNEVAYNLGGRNNHTFSNIFPIYDWENDGGYDNLGSWIELAAQQAMWARSPTKAGPIRIISGWKPSRKPIRRPNISKCRTFPIRPMHRAPSVNTWRRNATSCSSARNTATCCITSRTSLRRISPGSNATGRAWRPRPRPHRARQATDRTHIRGSEVMNIWWMAAMTIGAALGCYVGILIGDDRDWQEAEMEERRQHLLSITTMGEEMQELRDALAAAEAKRDEFKENFENRTRAIVWFQNRQRDATIDTLRAERDALRAQVERMYAELSHAVGFRGERGRVMPLERWREWCSANDRAPARAERL